MKHLYIIVEGPTELEFINRILIPYFNSNGIISHIQEIKEVDMDLIILNTLRILLNPF